jgi:hypothetical protein
MMKYPRAFDFVESEGHVEAARVDLDNARRACSAILAVVSVSTNI